MAFALDPDLIPVLTQRAKEAEGITLPERDDPLGLRAIADQTIAMALGALPEAPDVRVSEHATTSTDGAPLRLRWYQREGGAARPAVVYAHGGGMIAGTLENYDPLARHYTQVTGVPFLVVEYRLAPEHTGTTLAEDCFAGLNWLMSNAVDLGVDPTRVAVMGDSGGGGVAAGVAILARDHGIALARQILVYPMLDDRNTEPDAFLVPTATWTYDNNYTGWHALLGAQIGAADVPPVAAPARLTDFTGLASAYIEVGELDIFRDESIDYAARLLRAGVSCELHVHPGAPHGHDWLDQAISLSTRSVRERLRFLDGF